MQYASRSVPGLVRAHNEDCVLSCPELGLWVIADGMGGHQRGEVASAIVIECITAAIQQGDSLLQAVQAANQAIIQAASLDPASLGMGSTVVAVRFVGAEYQLAWLGDSRAYLLSPEVIRPLSKDHSWVQAMLDAGQLSVAEAKNHPRKNVITQCLGQPGLELDVGLRQGKLLAGERLLLCSDGLHGELSESRLLQMGRAGELPAAVDELIAAANEAGGKDNISCVLLALEPADEPLGVTRVKRFLSSLRKGKATHS